MGSRRQWCRLVSDGVGVVVSTVATCIVGAVLNPALGAGFFVVGSTVFAVLATGREETLAVRLLAQVRRLREDELAAIRPAIAVLEELDLASPAVVFMVRDGQAGIGVSAAGRRTVVVSRGVFDAIASGRVRADEIAALLAHAIGRIRLSQTRYDVALEFWMLPWRALQSIAHVVGRVAGALPLTALAWRLRFVTGVVALVQCIVDGRAVFGAIGALVVALSYALPWAERQATLLAEDEADVLVAAAGLGDALARFFERGRRTPRVRVRVYRLRTYRVPAAEPAVT